MLEVLTDEARNASKAFLWELGISCVIAGGDELDSELLPDEFASLFGIETLMLVGGGVLNWSFIPGRSVRRTERGHRPGRGRLL